MPEREAALDARTFRFPHRADDGAFSKIVHKDNANCALDLMEKAWRTERDALMVEVKRLRATCAKWNEIDLSREIRVGVRSCAAP